MQVGVAIATKLTRVFKAVEGAEEAYGFTNSLRKFFERRQEYIQHQKVW